jgi:hypothetical protein
LNDITEELAARDAETLSIVNDIYEKNMINSDFRKYILHLDLSKTLNVEAQEAVDMLGKTIISYGEYAGYSIDQIGIDKASRVLTDEYLQGIKVHGDTQRETQQIIKYMKI